MDNMKIYKGLSLSEFVFNSRDIYVVGDWSSDVCSSDLVQVDLLNILPVEGE